MHSFSLYINKYVIALFRGNAEFSENYSDSGANTVCLKARKTKGETKERERERGKVFVLMKGASMTCFGRNYWDKGCQKERQIKEKVKFALYVG